ncbi:hypothetical protein HGRIS_012161 [Hohenbuehelia grisea]|uniref:Uncharacterized protein n=1 Tax=Hohenbuehelia grisea TaxID=104357 RepID=A0ABR3IRI0_9AGAR
MQHAEEPGATRNSRIGQARRPDGRTSFRFWRSCQGPPQHRIRRVPPQKLSSHVDSGVPSHARLRYRTGKKFSDFRSEQGGIATTVFWQIATVMTGATRTPLKGIDNA